MKDFLYRITAKRPMRLIEIEGQPYLERYYIGTLFGRQVWLHRFIRQDSERHLHSHPWPATSVILTGGYLEERGVIEVTVSGNPTLKKNLKAYSAGQVNHIAADKLHRIASVQVDTWTLMIVGKRHGRGWGFVGETDTGGITYNHMTVCTRDDWHQHAWLRHQVYRMRLIRSRKHADQH